MQNQKCWTLLLALCLTACSQAPASNGLATTPWLDNATDAFGVLQASSCRFAAPTASSELTWAGEAHIAAKALDASRDTATGKEPIDTHWASVGRTGSVTVQNVGGAYIGNIRLKVNKNSTFRVFLDGILVGNGTGQNWQLQDFSVNRSGTALRIEGDAGPEANNFMVFELTCGAPGGGGGEGFDFVSNTEDRVSSGNSATPGAGVDGHYRLRLNLAAPSTITGIDLMEIENATRAETGARWSSRISSYWLLGVLAPGETVIQPQRASLGSFGAGPQTFDLYANNYGSVFTGGGKSLRLEITFSGGGVRSFERSSP